jgi:hypothetical protein
LVDESGSKVLSRLQADVLRKLATSTGGQYVVAGTGGDIPAMIELAVQGMDVFEMEAGQSRVVVEFFQWAVLPGILFLMAAIVAGTRWSRIAIPAAAGLMVLFADDAQANALRDAKTAFFEGRYDQARDAYRFLAKEKTGDDAAKMRLAEGLSAYEAGDLRGARSAYSGALLSSENLVSAKAHEGMGNTLFQLGWMGISGSRYPTGKAIPEMERFDQIVREQLQKMREEKVPEKGDTSGYLRMEAVMVNWSDAVRHYRTALVKNSKDNNPGRNKETTLVYLRRLAELLDEEKKQTEQEMMRQQQQQDAPFEGEGEGDKPKEGDSSGEGDKGEKGDDEKQPDSKKPDDKEKGENEKGEKDGDQPNDPTDDDSEDGDSANPGETPEDLARRKLKENSDVEKGSPFSGRREFKTPDKDW